MTVLKIPNPQPFRTKTWQLPADIHPLLVLAAIVALAAGLRFANLEALGYGQPLLYRSRREYAPILA